MGVKSNTGRACRTRMTTHTCKERAFDYNKVTSKMNRNEPKRNNKLASKAHFTCFRSSPFPSSLQATGTKTRGVVRENHRVGEGSTTQKAAIGSAKPLL